METWEVDARRRGGESKEEIRVKDRRGGKDKRRG